jgi:hypothetical protein
MGVKTGSACLEHPVAKLSALLVVHLTSFGPSPVAIASIRYSPSSVGLSQEAQPK